MVELRIECRGKTIGAGEMNTENFSLQKLIELMGEIKKPVRYLYIATLDDMAEHWEHLKLIDECGHDLVWDDNLSMEGKLVQVNMDKIDETLAYHPVWPQTKDVLKTNYFLENGLALISTPPGISFS